MPARTRSEGRGVLGCGPAWWVHGAIAALVLVWLSARHAAEAAESPEEFNGPFESYLSVKSPPFRAVGDGVSDDTAAIQAAIDALGRDEDKAVLYFPAGTYRVSSTILFPGVDAGRLANKLILGEDPATTRFVWVGAEGADVMWMRSVHSSRWGRFTVDGARKARAAIRIERDAPRGAEVSHYLQYHDIVMTDARYGVLNSDDLLPKNDMDAEVSILRCRFLNHTEAGFYTFPGNGFDYWLRACEFENCRIGAGSFNGDFRVWHSVFRNSGEVDVFVKGHRNAGIHGNYSRGSRRFAYIQSSNGILEDNVVINPVETDAVRIASEYWRQGSLVVLDNQFVSGPGVTRGPVIRELVRVAGGTNPMPGLVIAGNRFTVPDPLALTPHPTLDFNNTTVPRSAIAAVEPALPATPRQVKRPVFTVKDASDLQEKIDQAVTFARSNSGSRPVVHVPSGRGKLTAYRTTKTVTIPGEVELSLVGDGFMSRLGWRGEKGGGPVLLLKGPSRVTLRDLFFFDDVIPAADIVVEDADQAGARVRFDNSNIGGGGLLVDGLTHARVDLVDSLPYAIRVRGGSAAGDSRVGWFAGASSGAATYEVEAGGRLLVQDVWFEDGERREVFRASGSGQFDGHLAVTSSYFFNNAGPGEPVTRVTDFRGLITLLGADITSGAAVRGGEALRYLNLLADHPILSGTASQEISWTFGDKPPMDPGQLAGHLSFLRAARLDRLDSQAPVGVTDVRLHRLNIYIGGDRGLVVLPGKWRGAAPR